MATPRKPPRTEGFQSLKIGSIRQRRRDVSMKEVDANGKLPKIGQQATDARWQLTTEAVRAEAKRNQRRHVQDRLWKPT
uniref:Uncharacterized protein n=1 Tax=Oryza meridionalis TaxID=40149 RepID=A0A0E0F310_9ORYZ